MKADEATLEAVLREIENAGDKLAELTSMLVRIPTVSPPGDTRDLVSFLDGYFRAHGIETAVHELVPTKANFCATVPGRGEGRLLWVGHIDVVPVGSLDAWDREPFSGDIANVRVYGRGATDMKGADAAALVAATLLHRLGDRLGPTVEFWFTCDEEVGGADGARKLAEGGYFRGDACIIGDGWSGERAGLDIGCKGSLGTTLKAKGRTGHASRPYMGDNAIDKLLAAIPFARRIGEYRLDLPEELLSVLRESGEDIIDNGRLTGEAAEEARRSFFYPSVNLSIVSGGVKSNVIPDEASATFDIRLSPGCDREKVRQRMLELIAEAGIEGVTAEVRQAAFAGYYESPGHPFVRHMASVLQRLTGEQPRLKVLSGGTDGVSIHHLAGIPCVGFGAGLPEAAHSPNELVTVSNLVRAAKVYATAALTFAPDTGE
jgi:succinyl-diaminopimelate desuccinylase